MTRSAPPKRSPSEGGDERYLDFIRSLLCCAPGPRACHAPAPQHPHHSTGAGLALKAPDRETMPLCWHHHRAFHDGNGPFEHMTREDRRLWQEEMVGRCQRIWQQVVLVFDPALTSEVSG